MPSPPRKNESTQAFMARCMAYMAGKHGDNSRAQRAAICYSMARQAGRRVPEKGKK